MFLLSDCQTISGCTYVYQHTHRVSWRFEYLPGPWREWLSPRRTSTERYIVTVPTITQSRFFQKDKCYKEYEGRSRFGLLSQTAQCTILILSIYAHLFNTHRAF